MSNYIRIKSRGEANFILSERFESVEKAADPNAQGELVECEVSSVKDRLHQSEKGEGWTSYDNDSKNSGLASKET